MEDHTLCLYYHFELQLHLDLQPWSQHHSGMCDHQFGRNGQEVDGGKITGAGASLEVVRGPLVLLAIR